MNKKKKGIGVEIHCADCKKRIMIYRKKDADPLIYCDTEGILFPKQLAMIKDNPEIKSPNQLAYLSCDCGKCIGLPVMRDSGKLSFRLVERSYVEKEIDLSVRADWVS